MGSGKGRVGRDGRIEFGQCTPVRFLAVGRLAIQNDPPDRNGASASLRENGFF